MANLPEQAVWETGVYQLETSDPVMGGVDGVDNKQAKQLANRTRYLKAEVEKRASLASPALTGVPTAPTASQSTNNTQIATTAFVKSAIAALVGSAPAALDTLTELATALGNDSNLKQVLLAEIGNKASKSEFTSFLDLFIGAPIAIPTATLPVINIPGYTVMTLDGGRFSTSMYPKLAKVYPTGVKPDLRGEFIRGWSNGRNVDAGRGILTTQGDTIRNILGRVWGVYTNALTEEDANDWVNGAFSASLRSGGKGTTIDDGFRYDVNFDLSRVVPTANETRPRNVAFQYICLAA